MKNRAREFAKFWAERRGSEKSEAQQFWNKLLREVLLVSAPETHIRYEVEVKYDDGSTKFIDAWIPSSKVLIEHKSRGIDLDKIQENHNGLTPYGQAKEYDNNRHASEAARWIVVSNFDEIRIHDMEADRPEITYETIRLAELEKECHRLGFLVSAEDTLRRKEKEVSITAGKVVGKLYAAFLEMLGDAANDPITLQNLNKLCVRLVFCVYAEDAGVFHKDQFLNFLRKFHPSSYHLQIAELFKVLRLKSEERGIYFSEELKAFPYVGGGLFKDDVPILPFNEKIASILLNDASEDFDWSEISPTIFGAVFESTLNPETRRKGGMHYTSVENIHKVIDPLFLDDLKAELKIAKSEPNAKKQKDKLVEFQKKLGALKFLDPACGSGNFLTETYLSLRKLENEALEARFKYQGELDYGDLIHVSINQFYGIEINDFAVTVAQTAMWIAECKMMEETAAILSRNLSPLPLTDSAKIIEGNALRMDWEENLRLNERLPEAHFDYIMGNPPFIGYSNQSPEQKKDMLELWLDEKGRPYKTAGKIDYVAAWYWKAAALMRGTSTRGAFVSTNSITQGEQVAAVWKPLKERFGLEIDFAWKTFVWDSEATEKAHVHVVVIGFECAPSGKHRETETRRFLYDVEGGKAAVKHINGYLVDADDVWIENRTKPLCNVPEMYRGCQPTDNGHLILSKEEYDELLKSNSATCSFVRPFMMGKDFIDRKPRYCLWLDGVSPALYRKDNFVMNRVELVRQFRLSSPKDATRKKAATPMLFDEIKDSKTDYVAVPIVSSQRRDYLPMEWLNAEVIPGNKLFVLTNVTRLHLGILISSVHMAWMRATCGRLKSDYSYSNTIVYNNFPWPSVSPFLCVPPEAKSALQAKIEKTAQAILDARALPQYKDCSLADLYDPLTMPPELRRAHAANDAAVMEAYGFDKSLSEPEIVSHLFELYAKLTK